MTALQGTITEDPHATGCALLAVAATIAVHLSFGGRTILSVGIGTAVYVLLLNTL